MVQFAFKVRKITSGFTLTERWEAGNYPIVWWSMTSKAEFGSESPDQFQGRIQKFRKGGTLQICLSKGGHHSDSGVYKRFILKNRSRFFPKGGRGHQAPPLDPFLLDGLALGLFQTSNFIFTESNANAQLLLFYFICIRFGTCEVRRLKQTLVVGKGRSSVKNIVWTPLTKDG